MATYEYVDTNTYEGRTYAIGVDIAPNGVNITNSTIWEEVLTIAGNQDYAETNAINVYADGVGTNALFNYPEGIALDTAGNLYVADTYNSLIRMLIPANGTWTATTIGGSPPVDGAPIFGSADGVGDAALF